MSNFVGVIPLSRGRDNHGAGYFGASRANGTREHNGHDFISNDDGVQLEPGDPVLALMDGEVTKLGYPYAHDLSMRYVQVTDPRGYALRYFYVLPEVEQGAYVTAGSVLGRLQRLKYEGIKQHFHFEVVDGGRYIDPIKFLSGDV